MSFLSRHELAMAIRERVEADPAFAVAFVNDPRAALADLVGTEIPAEFSIAAHQETSTSFHFVLPAPAEFDEVAEEDLSLVAGGDWGTCTGDNTCDTSGGYVPGGHYPTWP